MKIGETCSPPKESFRSYLSGTCNGVFLGAILARTLAKLGGDLEFTLPFVVFIVGWMFHPSVRSWKQRAILCMGWGTALMVLGPIVQLVTKVFLNINLSEYVHPHLDAAISQARIGGIALLVLGGCFLVLSKREAKPGPP
jgi:drug/metabolite transporter (DMT)-like permease